MRQTLMFSLVLLLSIPGGAAEGACAADGDCPAGYACGSEGCALEFRSCAGDGDCEEGFFCDRDMECHDYGCQCEGCVCPECFSVEGCEVCDCATEAASCVQATGGTCLLEQVGCGSEGECPVGWECVTPPAECHCACGAYDCGDLDMICPDECTPVAPCSGCPCECFEGEPTCLPEGWGEQVGGEVLSSEGEGGDGPHDEEGGGESSCSLGAGKASFLSLLILLLLGLGLVRRESC